MSTDVYSMATDLIVAELERGVVPWKKPWATRHYSNYHTGRRYTGINPWLLNIVSIRKGFTCPWWIGFQQAKERGGTVKAGERGSMVVYFKMQEKEKVDEVTGVVSTVQIPFLRYFTVFNLQQTTIPVPREDHEPFSPIELCEQIIAGNESCPPIRHGKNSAYYSPLLDEIGMPDREQFHLPEGYYDTLFHEMIHSTGHEKRLNRRSIGSSSFGSTEYSREELVAEIGGAFLCNQAGITSQVPNNAAYVQNWLRVLKGDKKLVVKAASEAQKAAEYVVRGRLE